MSGSGAVNLHIKHYGRGVKKIPDGRTNGEQLELGIEGILGVALNAAASYKKKKKSFVVAVSVHFSSSVQLKWVNIDSLSEHDAIARLRNPKTFSATK